MEDMVVVVYDNQHSAVENMRTLRGLDDDWVVYIRDAVAVARDSHGKLRIQDSYKTTSRAGAGWGVLLGSILGGLALAPFTVGLSTAAAAGAVAAGAVCSAGLGGMAGAIMATGAKEAGGISEKFVSEVSATIERGQSAIFVLVERFTGDSRYREGKAEYFRGTGGKIIRTNFTLSEQERIQQILTGTY